MTAQAISAVLARLEAGTCDTRAAAGLIRGLMPKPYKSQEGSFDVAELIDAVEIAGECFVPMNDYLDVISKNMRTHARAEQADARVAALEAHLATAQAEMERALPILQKYLKHPNDQHDMEEFRKAAKGKSE